MYGMKMKPVKKKPVKKEIKKSGKKIVVNAKKK